jgi:hypothetical protein
MVTYTCGHGTSSETGIHLQLEATVTADLVLKPGSANESVTVRADEVQLDLTHPDRGVVFSQDELDVTPFNSGNPLLLANAEPGVVFTGNVAAGWVRPFDNGAINQFSANGQGADSNDFQLDGSPNNTNSFGARDIGYVPPVDTIQEMKFISNPYDAQYGHTGGGIFDMVTKYGTNTLHGHVYENARRTWLDANSHFNDAQKAAKASDTRNQFGAEVNGPVMIPHFYNGRDKTFFQAQYERYSQNTPLSGLDSVPELDPDDKTKSVLQTGNFINDYYYDSGAQMNKPTVIFDPLSTPDPQAGNWWEITRTPFANNQIPTGRMNSTSLAMAKYLPLPNRTTPATLNYGMKNYFWQHTETDRFDNASVRLDRNFGANDRTYLRFSWNKRIQVGGETYNGIPGAAGAGVFPLVRQNHFLTGDWLHTFNASSLFDLHFSYARYVYDQKQGYPFDLANVGLGSMSSEVTASLFPQVDMNTYTTFGGAASNGGNKRTVSNTIAAMPMWTYIKGAHTIKVGLDERWMHASNYVGGASSGYFYVDAQWTQQYPWCWGCSNGVNTGGLANGDSVASFLLGSMDNGYLNNNAALYFSYPYSAPFFQDDWKVTHKLTINLGFRWDLLGPPSEMHNKINSDFDTTSVNPVASQVSSAALPAGTSLLGGLTFAGVNGRPRTIFGMDWLDLQPRLGFAYALNNKTVVHGGIGTTHEATTGQGDSQGFSQSTSYTASVTNNYRPDASKIDNPFPTIAKPAGSTLGLMTSLGNNLGVSNRDFKMPGTLNYSLDVERQIGTHSTLDVAYVGSMGFRLDTSSNINPISQSFAASCNLEMGATSTRYGNCLNSGSNPAWVANPFLGVSGFSTASTGNGNGYYTNQYLSAGAFTRPYPEFGDITQTEQNDGRTQYHSLEVVGSHRWHNALTAHGSFVWSKTMDSGGWSDQVYRIRSHYIDLGTRKWRYTANVDWHIPVGAGRTFLSNSNRLVDAAVGGWTMGAIYYYEAGTPAGVGGGFEVVKKQHYGVHRTYEDGVHLIRAASHCVGQYNADSSGNYSLGDVSGQSYDGCTTTSSGHEYDFVVRPAYAAVQNVSDPGVYNPNGQNMDLSMSKSFPVWERAKLEVRFEGYDVFNHPSWQGHGYWWSGSDVHNGTINMTWDGQTNIPRNVQLSAKIVW